MPVTSQVSNDGQEVKISISGRFDFNDHQTFRNAYQMGGVDSRYILDLKDTEYMDSSALGMLLLLREHAGGDHGSVTIVNCRPEVEKILTISNFQKLFSIN